MSISEKREKALQETLKHLEKTLGKNSNSTVSLMKDLDENLEFIPTGSLSLDYVTGNEDDLGILRGRSVVISGTSGSGKTTLALGIIKTALKQGKTCAIIDCECTITKEYCQKVGIDVNSDNLIYASAETAEESSEIIVSLISSGVVDVVLLDSLSALVPKDSMEKSFLNSEKIAGQAALVTRLMKRITFPLHKTGAVFIGIAQMRKNLNKMTPYSPDMVMHGASATKFFSSTVLLVKQSKRIKNSAGEHIGNELIVDVEKSKVGIPHRKAEVTLIFGKGISRPHDLLNMGKRYDVLRMSGSTYYFGDVKIGVGREKAAAFLEENPDLMDRIEEEIRACKSSEIKDIHDDDGGEVDLGESEF